ncbi:MAG: DUF4344 domain-containing metallopeptidase [Dongiaceae bacterium]
MTGGCLAWRRLWPAAAIFAVLSGAPPSGWGQSSPTGGLSPAAPAQPASPDGGGLQEMSPSDDPDAAPSDDPVWGYFLGKTTFIFYHELAGALLQRFEPSYSGKETIARDQLAALLLIAEAGKRYGGVVGLDAVLGWFESWRQAQQDDSTASVQDTDETSPPSWESVNVDAARLAQIACLIYGSDPSGHLALRESNVVSSVQLDSCAAYYAKTRDRWLRSLQQVHVTLAMSAAVDGNPAQPTPAQPTPAQLTPAQLTLEYRPTSDQNLAETSGWLRDVELFDGLIRDANLMLAMPAPIKVALDQCGAGITGFDSGSGTLRLCYELLRNVYDAASTQNVEAPPE